MQNIITNNRADEAAQKAAKRLLMVGPKPPPIGGSPLTVQAMLDELALYPAISVSLINTSPSLDVRKKMTGFNFEKVQRSFAILPQFIGQIGQCDAALVFANDLFAATMVPFLFGIARIFRKPFYLKPVGAGLDLFLAAQKRPVQWFLLGMLRSLDGILSQTSLLKSDLNKLGCNNTYYLPGCRPAAANVETRAQKPPRAGNQLRLIFLAHITRQKGPLLLLNALQDLAKTGEQHISCDFYGPIHDEIRDDFTEQMKLTPNVTYCGTAEAGTGTQLIANYDALVLPTYFDTEGHPGVLIEAMHAGVPVVTTRIRTISDLVTDGENGLLIPIRDSAALANAIRTLANQPDLCEKLGQANYAKGREFRADVVVAQMLKIIFPTTSLEKGSSR